VLKNFTNVSYVGQDILKVKLTELTLGRKHKVIGNLPYYITAPIVEKLLTSPDKPERIVIMVQKEVAERMSAKPGSKTYGSFSLFCQFYAAVELNSLVSKSSFLPWPEVGSAVITLIPHSSPSPYPVQDEKLFFKIVHAAFQQRRKMLRNSLASFKGLEQAGINLSRRPEMLALEEFAALANSCYNYRHEE
jgi:16S rRNA (adenine1518-N6/adenine1519-N6)-dimethyltransferase